MNVSKATTQRTALSTDDGDGSAADADTPPEPAESAAAAANRAPEALAERVEVQRLSGDNPHNVSIDEPWLHDRLVAALTHLARPVARISVTIVGDEKMRALNQAHRGVSDTTDVLSFEPRDDDDAIEADIVICADEAARRATELEHTPDQRRFRGHARRGGSDPDRHRRGADVRPRLVGSRRPSPTRET
ncbi:MAG: rRNA maturation RNase YbeY [Planctomycetota bacterium]|jgi:hypothetical protein